MECYDRFVTKMSLTGKNLREEKIFDSRKFLEFSFSDDPSYTDVCFWDLNREDYSGCPKFGIRLYDGKLSEYYGKTLQFITQNDVCIEIGDVIFDPGADRYYLCIEAYTEGDICRRGKFSVCNWILRWQDDKGKIYNYPCYDRNSTQYNSGETTYRQYTVGSTQHIIQLPADENTVALRTPKRFYLDRNKSDPISYIITQNDTISFNYGKGIVKITLSEFPNNNETDRPDLGICDYIEPELPECMIEYDSLIIRSGGDKQVFKSKFFDDNITPQWNIVCDFKERLIVDQSDDWISIAIDDDAYIDDEFKLELSDSGGIYYAYLIIKIDSLL